MPDRKFFVSAIWAGVIVALTIVPSVAFPQSMGSGGYGYASSKSYTALRAGMWEIRTSTRMQGMPSELPPLPYTANQCLTQELLDNQENLDTVTAMRGQCTIHNATVTNERTEWQMVCYQNGMKVEANGVITPLSQHAYTGNVNFLMHTTKTTAIRGVVNIQGMWQGDCKGGAGSNTATPSFHSSGYTSQ
ncbi:MAG: DUF3617 domain-containing protein [Alphaproteobacteria bacterium]|nr:DUF3617 domain-containing protein [Alphaproteobacteria bacterium]